MNDVKMDIEFLKSRVATLEMHQERMRGYIQVLEEEVQTLKSTVKVLRENNHRWFGE